MEEDFLVSSKGEYIYVKVDISGNPRCEICEGVMIELEGGRFKCPKCNPFK